MKKIEVLENLKTNEDFKEKTINRHFYWAYEKAKDANLQRLDFEETGFHKDHLEIIENLERFNIEEFTISDQSTGLMESLLAFKQAGYLPTDLIEQKTGRTNWNSKIRKEEKETKPAILLRKLEKLN